ncbi:hypothetical protein Taro_027167, partial [Colocasia esculenta]|nr:hypothetical protein [Colocasia esculenta]
LGSRRVTVGNATPRPVASWGPKAKSLGQRPFPLFWLFSFLLLPEEEKFPLSSSGGSGLAERRRLVRRGGVSCGARRRRPWRLVAFVGDHRMWIPSVGLPADVATAERIATSEKASPRTLPRCDLGLVAVALTVAMVSRQLRRARQYLVFLVCFRGHDWHVGVCPRASAVRGSTGRCSSLTSWSDRGAGWFCLWALDIVEVQDVGACVVRLWSHVVALVFRELLCLGGCVTRVCFRIVLLWPDPGCGSWRCSSCFRMCLTLLSSFASAFVRVPAALAGRDSLSQEFVSGQSWWRFVAPCVASGVSCERECSFTVASFPAGSECVAAAAGGACCECGCCFARAAVGFVLDLHVRVGVSRRLREPACGVAFTGAGLWSAEPVEVGIFARAKQMLVCSRSSSLLVLVEVRFPQNCVVLVSGCCGIALWVEVHRLAAVFWWCFPELFVVVLVSVVWLVTVALPSRLRCIAWLSCVLVRFPRTIGCCPGENDTLVVLVEVLPEPVCVASAVYCVLSVSRLLGLRPGVAGQGVVSLTVYLAVVLASREVGFVSRTLWALPDGGLVSSMGVWLVVLLWKCQSRQFGAMSRTVATFVVKTMEGGNGDDGSHGDERAKRPAARRVPCQEKVTSMGEEVSMVEMAEEEAQAIDMEAAAEALEEAMKKGEMRARVSLLLVLAMYLALPVFQRGRLDEMGFGEVLRMEGMRVDAPLTQALKSRWDTEETAFVFPWLIPDLEDVSRITRMRVYGHLVSGFTYPYYRDVAQRLLGLTVGRRASPVPEEIYRRFDSLGISHRQTTIGGFFPLLQAWTYLYLPGLGRGILERPGLVPLARRWVTCRDTHPLKEQLSSIYDAIDVYLQLDVV